MELDKILTEKIKKEGKGEGAGCLMLNFKNKIKNWDDVLKMIEPDDLYDDETKTYGFEKDPHITILYGFKPEVDGGQIKDLFENITQYIKVKLVGIDIFPGGDKKPFDVVKFTVESEDLLGLHKVCKENLPNKVTFPDYKPHMTIAYVKAGRGERYVREFKKDFFMEGNTFVYSTAEKNKIDWKIKKKYSYKIEITEEIHQQPDLNFPPVSDYKNGVWYHGRTIESDVFSLDYVGLPGATDQEGAGFYFSNYFEESSGYAGHGGYLFKCQMSYTKARLLLENTKPKPQVIKYLLDNAPELEDTLYNFAEDPGQAMNIAFRGYMNYDNVRDAYQTIENDFYRYNPKQFLINISKFYDGYMVHRDGDKYHLIVYNPNIIKVIDKKQV